MKTQPNRVEYEKYGTKWGFTLFYDNWSASYGGYDTKSKAKAAFERLKASRFWG